MKKSLNLDLLEFHVREATQELDLLLDSIQYAKDETRREGAVYGDGNCDYDYGSPDNFNIRTGICDIIVSERK